MSWLGKIPIQKRTLELCVIASIEDHLSALDFIPENLLCQVTWFHSIEELYDDDDDDDDDDNNKVYIVVEYDTGDNIDRECGFDSVEIKTIFDNLTGAIDFATMCSKQYKYTRKYPLMETEPKKWLNQIKLWANDRGDMVYITSEKCHKSLTMKEYNKS